MYTRHSHEINGKRISYLDYQGSGSPLVALHGHFGRDTMFSGLSEALGSAWRVISFDQQGHGWSDQSGDYSRASYIQDIVELINMLDIGPVVLYGHSLGGVNAYQVAAQYPQLVRAIIVEDIGAVVNDDLSFILDWPERFSTVRSFRNFLKERGFNDDTYFLESLVEYSDGWGLRFNYQDMVLSQQLLNGDHWEDWLASKCPALLLHGHKTWVMTTEHAREMKLRRPNTELIEFPESGHTIRDDKPLELYQAVKDFLSSIECSK